MKLKIAILGTKGIPNRYGGFEQFAEYLSFGLAKKGHEVTVYSPDYHPFQQKEINNVKIKHVYCPEKLLGGAAHYIYDHLSLKDAVRADYDLIYEAGYGSCAFAIRHFRRRGKTPILITNMDGMEWKRQKFSPLVRYITRKAEHLAVKYSDVLVADNIGIKNYFMKEYGVTPVFLPYGAQVVDAFDPQILQQYSLSPKRYFLIIARIEPENNIETMIKGFILSKADIPLVIIGGLGTRYAKRLLAYARENRNIIFPGGIYDSNAINSLRHFSKAYLHGHSVGGTNPSLLEAMACGSFIVAHDNEFNKSVLEGNGVFFNNASDLSERIAGLDDLLAQTETTFCQNCIDLIRTKYDWGHIIDLHEAFFRSIVNPATGTAATPT